MTTIVADESEPDAYGSTDQTIVNAFTVDVEDYFQVSAFEKHISKDEWRGIPSRVEGSTRRILDLLDDFDVKGTFFILGWVADEFPGLIREIDERGHELGCHSYWHRLVYEQSQDDFREDLRDARRAIEDASGKSVSAYRAPSFSVVKESLWALDILAEEGFRVDSSVFPIHHDRYGIPDQPVGIHQRDTKSGDITEYPPSVVKIGKLNLPVSGGGYFRLYPYRFTRSSLRRINSKDGRPFMFYIHPWEVDPDQPKIKGPKLSSRFRHRVNLKTNDRKLQRLLSDFNFGTMSQSIASVAGHAPVDEKTDQAMPQHAAQA